MTPAAGFFAMFAPASAATPPYESGAPLPPRDPALHAAPVPSPAPPPMASRVTVRYLLDLYEKDYLPERAPNTQRTTRLLYVRFRKDFGHLLLSDLTPAWIRAWRDALSERYAPTTINRYLAALAGPLTAAVRDLEWLSANPVHKVRRKPEPPGRMRFLSDQERQRLLTACQRSENPHLDTVVRLALTTGARKNEMLSLRWADVDLEQGLLRLATTKNKERRAVPVRGEALTLLRRQGRKQKPEAWVFARRDRLKPVLIEQAWQTAKRRSGLTDIHFHDLRHTCASYLAMSGASLLEISTILGHKSLKQTMKYAHLTSAHTGGVIERMLLQRPLGAQEESLYVYPQR